SARMDSSLTFSGPPRSVETMLPGAAYIELKMRRDAANRVMIASAARRPTRTIMLRLRATFAPCLPDSRGPRVRPISEGHRCAGQFLTHDERVRRCGQRNPEHVVECDLLQFHHELCPCGLVVGARCLPIQVDVLLVLVSEIVARLSGKQVVVEPQRFRLRQVPVVRQEVDLTTCVRRREEFAVAGVGEGLDLDLYTDLLT